jgi:hypothetical protein
MSFKTLRKRIALVAVSALGAGFLAVVAVAPANAAAAGLVIQGNGGSATADSNGLISSTDSLGTVAGGSDNTVEFATATVTARLQVGGRLAITTAGSHSTAVVRVLGANISSFSQASSATPTVNTAGTVVTSDTDSGKVAAALTVAASATGAAGSQFTIEHWNAYSSYSGGSDADLVITVTIVAAGSQGVYSATASSTKFSAQAYGDTTTYAVTDADDSLYVDDSETGATITYSFFDANNVALVNAVIGCSATGAVLTSVNSQSATNFLSATSSAIDADGAGYCSIKRAVRTAPATSTVTITVNGVVAGSRSFTFVGEAAKVLITSVKREAVSSTKTTSYLASVVDSAGNALAASTAFTVDTSRYNATVTAQTGGTTSAYDDATFGGYGYGGWTCSAIEGSASLRVYALKADGITKVYSDDFTAWCVGDPDSYTASLDKASYAPGEIATLTITAKSSKGNLTNSRAYLSAASLTDDDYPVAITGTMMTPVKTPTNVDTFTNGVKTYKFMVGTTEGSYNMLVDLPYWNYTGGPQPITIAYKVASGVTTVSNAEVLAAIVKLIASINKQIRQLQKQLKKK